MLPYINMPHCACQYAITIIGVLILNTLSKRLIQLKTDRNLLQKDIAISAGLALRTYQYYEKGERIPDSETLSKLAAYFNVPVDYLTGNGLFAQFDEIIRYRPVIEKAISEIVSTDNTLARMILTAPNIKFVQALSAIISSIDFTMQEDGKSMLM